MAQSGIIWMAAMPGSINCVYCRYPSCGFCKYTPTPRRTAKRSRAFADEPGHPGRGEIVHIDVPSGNLEALSRTLDPFRLILQAACPSRDDGEQLLERMVKWTASRVSRT